MDDALEVGDGERREHVRFHAVRVHERRALVPHRAPESACVAGYFERGMGENARILGAVRAGFTECGEGRFRI